MKLHLPALLATSAVALLSACGGSGSDPSYETLYSSSDTSSKLGGVAFQSREGNEQSGLVRVSGKLRHDTGAVTISDGTYTLTDRNGADSNGLLTDGSAIAEFGAPDNYDYVQAFDAYYDHNGRTQNTVGFVGIETKPRDMPHSGRASYEGLAAAAVISPMGTSVRTTELSDGKSRVDANFSRGTVNVTLDDFDGANRAIINEIEVRDMAISGNRFSGGNVVTSKNGRPVNLVGSNADTNAEGAFFGYDGAISAPDEVAGAVVATGNGYGVVGAFVAD